LPQEKQNFSCILILTPQAEQKAIVSLIAT